MRSMHKAVILTTLTMFFSMPINSIAFADFNAGSLNRIDAGVIDQSVTNDRELRDKLENLRKEQEQRKLNNSVKYENQVQQPEQTMVDEQGRVYNPKFLLKGVNFTGNTIYSNDELNKYYADLIGKEVYIDQVLNATMEITKLYAKDGYITSQAYVPQQKVTNGIITIEIIESEIGNISVQGNKWARESYLRREVLSSNKLKEGKIFNVANIKTSLDDLNKEDYIQGKIVIEEGDTPKKTDVTLQVKDRFPLEVTIGMDNDGRTVVGRERGYLQIKDKNVFGLGDEFYVGGLIGENSGGWFTGYKIPVGKWGTKIGADYSFSSVNPGGPFREYDIDGKAHNVKVGIYQPIKKGDNYKIDADLSLNFLNAKTTSGLFDGAVLNDYQLRILRAGIDFQKDDSSGRWLSRAEASLGLKGLGATPQEPYLPKTGFQKYNLDVMRLQLLPKDMLLIARASGQYSPNKLYAIEQMQQGGQATVRGFEPALLLGDYGYFASLELRTPVPGLKTILPDKYKHFSDKVRLGYFYDAGYIGNNRTGISRKMQENFIHSVGVGVNFYLMKNLTASLNLAYPIHEPHNDVSNCKLLFNVSTDVASFFFKDPKESL